MKTKTIIGLGAACAVTLALIGCATTMTEREASVRATEVLKSSFAAKGVATLDRLDQDDVQRICTEYAGKTIPADVIAKIETSQIATITKPASGKLIGDWKAGEKVAQEGRGLQFSDAANGPRGGNCYACHQLAPQEISYGNLGPSLYHYGKLRGQSDAIVEYTYNKIFNSHAYSACSNMPRFGFKQILTPEQIADVVGLLLDPQSPVNR